MDANSNNVTPLYIERQPDWSQSPSLAVAHQTLVFEARGGLGQRIRQRRTPIYRLSYTERGLSPAQYAQRQSRAAAEVVSPLLVPFWTERCLLTHDMTSTTARIDIDPRTDFFIAGQGAYIGGEFRTIVAQAGRVLTLAAGAFTAWPAGTKAYPVRLCRRVQGSDPLRRDSLRSFQETLIFETID